MTVDRIQILIFRENRPLNLFLSITFSLSGLQKFLSGSQRVPFPLVYFYIFFAFRVFSLLSIYLAHSRKRGPGGYRRPAQ